MWENNFELQEKLELKKTVNEVWEAWANISYQSRHLTSSISNNMLHNRCQKYYVPSLSSSSSMFSHSASERWPQPHPRLQGVSWVSRSDLSCWMPYDRLFVKLLGFVCSLSPRLSLADSVPIVNVKGPGFVWPASLEPLLVQRELAYTHIHTLLLTLREHLLTYLPITQPFSFPAC